MRTERKICLPFYKIAYSVFFTLILSVVRGVGCTDEIGIALEPPMAILAAVFCADTYVQEILAKRSEVERLYPMKNRMASIFRRLFLQEVYLFFLAAAGYGMFYLIQRPRVLYGTEAELSSELFRFLAYAAAVWVTLNFWGLFSHTLACLFRSMWAGIGGCLVLWIGTNSAVGDRLFGKWNLFSYSFRNIEDFGDFSWVWGKAVSLLLVLAMALLLPKMIDRGAFCPKRKRGEKR